MAYAFVASVLGDGTGYFVSFKYGKEILYRFGFRRILASPRFTTLEGVFQNHSTSAIFTSRFLATGL